ncbi:unnamed protein product [Rhizophagus irregularis]|nr:unnamed protein product [Rhizophagus irregularis]
MNSNEDWYQSAIFEYKINEITEHFVNKDLIEYANQGNLREFINEKNRNENDFEWKERVNLATQIAEGLCYLHKLNIAHRDLHTKNILINDEPESRPLIDQVHLQLQSISLKPIFEGSNNPISIDTEKEKTPIGIISTPDSPIYDSNLLYGIREKWDNESRQWLRTGPVQIILREFRSKSTIKNLKLHLEFENAICCYGFTQNPETKCYYMVLKYANCGNFREYLWKNFPYADPEKRPTTLELLEELKTFISIPLKKHQFEAANFKRRSQPLGARPNQLSKDNVEIFVESISVIEAYKTCFRFTNKPLQLDFILSEPKNASEKSLYFNDQGLLECQLKRIDL